MADTVANFLIERPTEWGVRRIYGYPGEAINSFTITPYARVRSRTARAG